METDFGEADEKYEDMLAYTTLDKAYDQILGGVIAISPEFYSIALGSIAALCGRENDEQFLKDVKEHEKTSPCDLD